MHFGTIAKYAVLWLVYYIALSLATNAFNYVKIGKKEGGTPSLLIQMFFVFIGAEIMIAVQCITFHVSGFMWTEHSGVPPILLHSPLLSSVLDGGPSPSHIPGPAAMDLLSAFSTIRELPERMPL